MNVSIYVLLVGVLIQVSAASASCSRVKCGIRVPGLLSDMKDLSDAPTDFEELRGFLGNVKFFLESCGSCLMGSQLDLICDQTDEAVELLQNTIGLSSDFFNEEACRSGNFDKAIITPIPTMEGTCSIIDKGRCEKGYPQIVVDIVDVMSPPYDFEKMKDFLDTMRIFLDKCGACITGIQLSNICEYAEFAVETLTDKIGLGKLLYSGFLIAIAHILISIYI